MSVSGIRAIIRQHTGEHASDKVRITHQEVLAMIRSAKDHSAVTVGERAELLAALVMFGGNEIHPDIFSSPEDKAAIAATAISGIETGAKFEALPPREQARFIWECLIVGGGSAVGFAQNDIRFQALPATVGDIVERLLKAEREKAGPRYDDKPWLRIRAFARSGDVYAYVVSASWDRKDQKGSWDAEEYLGRSGELLKSTSGFVPPDPPD